MAITRRRSLLVATVAAAALAGCPAPRPRGEPGRRTVEGEATEATWNGKSSLAEASARTDADGRARIEAVRVEKDAVQALHRVLFPARQTCLLEGDVRVSVATGQGRGSARVVLAAEEVEITDRAPGAAPYQVRAAGRASLERIDRDGKVVERVDCPRGAVIEMKEPFGGWDAPSNK